MPGQEFVPKVFSRAYWHRFLGHRVGINWDSYLVHCTCGGYWHAGFQLAPDSKQQWGKQGWID